MDELGLFTAALGLGGPWRVARTEFDVEAAQLDLYLGFDRGARFACPAKDCAHGDCLVHDAVDKTWRHLDFFQHKVLLHARLPRVHCPEHGVRQVAVPWARPGSGFTLLFPGAGAQLRRGDADGESRRDDPRARHQDLASGATPRQRRPRSAGLHRRAPGGDG
ncbi:MAG: transposase family protein [Pseudonocardiaceae bacterium]